MGYTHYWRFSDKVSEKWYSEALKHIALMVNEEAKRVPLSSWVEDEEFNLDPEKEGDIFFNGVGDDAHEPFVLPAYNKGRRGFNFCKTARKPYDKIVVAALVLLERFVRGGVTISSDGTDLERLEGIQIAKKYLQENNQND